MTLSIQPDAQRSVTVRAPAKINLHLGVGRPREDGFHPLDTVFQAVGLYDDVRATDGDGTVTVEPASYLPASVRRRPREPGRQHRHPRGPPARRDRGRPRRAAARRPARREADPGRRRHGRRLRRRRRDPRRPGPALGRWALPTTLLLELAAALGSDVPFSLLGGTAHGTGRGELLHAIPDPTTWWWVVVPSPEGLSTPAVYRRFDEMFPDAPATPASSAGTLAALAAGDPDRLAAALHNDLEAPAIDLRPGPRRPDRPRRGRGRPARHGVGLRAHGGCSSAESGDHARALADAPPGRRPARRPGRQRPRGRARTSCPMSPALMANLLNLERVSKAYGVRPLLDGRLARHRARASGSAWSAATATARPRCSR